MAVRSKREFKFLREQVGYRQIDLAREMGVSERSVKRWEDIKSENYHAPEAAWEILDKAVDLQMRVVEDALSHIDEAIEELGYPNSIQLIYWMNQDEYDQHHCIEDGGDWRQVNANNRLIAYVLMDRGFDIEWIEASENTVPKMLKKGEIDCDLGIQMEWL